MLSWHVQNFVVSTIWKKLNDSKIVPINLDFDDKIVSETGTSLATHKVCPSLCHIKGSFTHHYPSISSVHPLWKVVPVQSCGDYGDNQIGLTKQRSVLSCQVLVTVPKMQPVAEPKSLLWKDLNAYYTGIVLFRVLLEIIWRTLTSSQPSKLD